MRDLFVNLSAQADNLGDIVIRRSVLDWLANDLEHRFKLVVFTGNMPADYLDAYSLDRFDAHVHRNPLRYQQALMKSILLGRADLFYLPGPVTYRTNVDAPTVAAKELVKSGTFVGNAGLVRARGGSVFTLGRAVRGGTFATLALERLLCRISNEYSVRDTISKDLVRRARLAPDFGFSMDAMRGDTYRDLVSLSFRGDTHLDDQFLDRLIGCVRASGREPVFVTQVLRDETLHSTLAQRYGCRLVSWDSHSRSSAAQLEQIMSIYHRSRAVVSNRLHGLVLGMLGGSAPIPVAGPDNDKLLPTLRVVTDCCSLNPASATMTEIVNALHEAHVPREVYKTVEAAGSKLDDQRIAIACRLNATMRKQR
ncbi:MAG: polysaccharide pyruvyl transferase family protein [Thermomicrobiales bacterium]